jgi:amidophosphoribosyltransferase
VFGIWGHPEAANLTYLGLHALQHRGQEAAGIVTSDGDKLNIHRARGLVQAAFTPKDLESLPGGAAIGHVRYSTAGGSHMRNAQPFAVDYARGSLAIAHNGNLTNHEMLRERLEVRGSIFQSTSDTETVVHLIAMSTQREAEDRIADALRQVEGAYSLLFLTNNQLIAVRDPHALRPLVLGKLQHDGKTVHVVASEPTSFDLIGAELVRDLEPGEMLVIDASGMRSSFPFPKQPRKMCIFEYVYFARPDSILERASVYAVRKALGERLAIEQPLPDGEGDAVVISVPDGGVPAAMGYAHKSALPFEMGLIRSHYVGRTFIEPQQSIRHFGVRLKLNPNRDVIAGKRVVVIDDSIVRGTTSRKIVRMVREAGAKEVHVRISSPPTMWPCYYGIDTPTRGELIASSHTIEEIGRYLSADSIGYLSLDGLVASVAAVEQKSRGGAALDRTSYCHACFSGEYPISLAPATRRPLRMVSA